MPLGVETPVVSLLDATTLTIATGAVTVTHGYHTIAAETGTTDDLDTITPSSSTTSGYVPQLVIKADTGDTITLKHQTGNIYIPGGGDVTLTENNIAVLQYDGTNWRLINAVGQAQTYTVTNGLTDRAFDADTVTLAELADVVYTLLGDLASMGIIKRA